MARWKAGDPLDCPLCPQRLFVIVCNERPFGHLRNLGEWARFDADFRAAPADWKKEAAGRHSCIGDSAFRLGATSGERRPSPEDDFPTSVAFQVMEGSADGQVVEVRYWEGVDIVDAFFKYRLENGRVIPLESWVVTRGHVAMLIAEVLVGAVLLALIFGGVWTYRWLRRRRRRSAGGNVDSTDGG